MTYCRCVLALMSRWAITSPPDCERGHNHHYDYRCFNRATEAVRRMTVSVRERDESKAMNNQHELKGLQVRKTKIEAEIKALDGERERCQQELGRKRNELNTVKQKIDQFAAREPVLTEHAMLRYVERVLGIDLQDVQRQILSEKNRAAIAFAGSCRIKAGGVELVVKDRVIVSVV